MDLLLNLCGIVVQQLIFMLDGKGWCVVIEVLFNMLLVLDYICKGEIYLFKVLMGKFCEQGMQIFDQVFYDLYDVGEIIYEDVIVYVDLFNDLCLMIKFGNEIDVISLDYVICGFIIEGDYDQGLFILFVFIFFLWLFG